MTKWEYDIVRSSYRMLELLNELGALGWEAVSWTAEGILIKRSKEKTLVELFEENRDC